MDTRSARPAVGPGLLKSAEESELRGTIVKIKKKVAAIVVASTAAAVASATLAAAPASAANYVAHGCVGRDDLVKVKVKAEGSEPGKYKDWCYANRGVVQLQREGHEYVWAFEISSGNNRICVLQTNRDTFTMKKGEERKWPDADPIYGFRILDPHQKAPRHCGVPIPRGVL